MDVQESTAAAAAAAASGSSSNISSRRRRRPSSSSLIVNLYDASTADIFEAQASVVQAQVGPSERFLFRKPT